MILYSQPLPEFVLIRANSWLIHSQWPEPPNPPILPNLPENYNVIMQNKPNPQKPKTTATPYATNLYTNIPPRQDRKNKPNQTQSRCTSGPNQTQSDPVPIHRRHTGTPTKPCPQGCRRIPNAPSWPGSPLRQSLFLLQGQKEMHRNLKEQPKTTHTTSSTHSFFPFISPQLSGLGRQKDLFLRKYAGIPEQSRHSQGRYSIMAIMTITV